VEELNSGNKVDGLAKWRVRIAHFRWSISSEMSEPKSAGGFPLGDSHYMAPECCENEDGPESDVFSFALILYEIVTGRHDFRKHFPPPRIAKMVVIE
jgi:serine/threonine protein kinase